MGCNHRNSTYPQFTDHCFTGEYPIKPLDANEQQFENNHIKLIINFMNIKFEI